LGHALGCDVPLNQGNYALDQTTRLCTTRVECSRRQEDEHRWGLCKIEPEVTIFFSFEDEASLTAFDATMASSDAAYADAVSSNRLCRRHPECRFIMPGTL
jgi:hypothetical protein